jgi:hypothetical protein
MCLHKAIRIIGKKVARGNWKMKDGRRVGRSAHKTKIAPDPRLGGDF